MNTLTSVGLIIRVVGEVMLGISVLRVHSRVMHDHKLDKRVFAEFARERLLGVAAVLFIILGAALELLAVWHG